MRSHWTNPTIIRRPTIAALSAAALLVACDQPAGPSRTGGRILADAAGTVSAHGNGQVAVAEECNTMTMTCQFGGQGAQFSFDFSGDNFDPYIDPVTGTFSVKFRETGDVVTYQGPATILPADHLLQANNVTCSVTKAGVTFSVTGCFLTAVDEANSDEFSFQFFGGGASGIAESPVVSGGMQID